MKTTEPTLVRRAGVLLITILSVPLSAVGAGVLFWGVHPVWLIAFWTIQGYPPGASDIVRWYAPGAFLIAPVIAAVPVGALIALGTRLLKNRLSYRARIFLSALVGFLLIPPLAYSLLLIYAEMWAYRALDVMMPTVARAYGMTGISSAVVGALIGATVRGKR
ncbi:MAG: hypothetical protein SNJ72_02485 [Fimbriimonadales bacterium]